VVMAAPLKKPTTDFVLLIQRFQSETPELEALWKTLVRLSKSYIFIGSQQKRSRRTNRKKNDRTIGAKTPPPGLTETRLEDSVPENKPSLDSISPSTSTTHQSIPDPSADASTDHPALTIALPAIQAPVDSGPPLLPAPVEPLQGSSSSAPSKFVSAAPQVPPAGKKRMTSDHLMKQESENFVSKMDLRLGMKDKEKEMEETEEKPSEKAKAMEMRRKDMGLVSWGEFESIEANKIRKKKKKKRNKG